ncbi:MAG: hypothetical protein ACJA1P_002651, partial [Maribacter sp.]
PQSSHQKQTSSQQHAFLRFGVIYLCHVIKNLES